MVRKWHEPDILLVNGDCIEGRQKKSGGAELITNDRNVQSEIALCCLKEWNAKQILMTYGTDYHCSETGEDFEYNIAKQLDAKIEGRLFFEVEGLTIDARHKVGRSIIPHGRATPLLREMMWNMLEAAEKEEPRANILIRSHVHYHIWVEQVKRVMFSTPALQLSRGRFGSRECTGETHWGAIRLTLKDGNIIGRDINVWNLRSNIPKLFKIR